MKIALTTLLLAFVQILSAQSLVEDVDFFPGPEWFQGTVVLNTGEEIQGLLKYNDKVDILSFEKGRDSRSFTARSVKTFSFYDEIQQTQRSFVSIPVEDTRNNVKRPLFFEVVMELNEFAVLSKLSPIKFEKREYTTPAMFNPMTGSVSAGRYYGYPSTVSLTETLFVLSDKGVIRPYMQIIEKDIDGMFFDRQLVKNRMLDEDAIRDNTGSKYKQLVEFAHKNKLSFEEKDELMLILKHYQSLVNN